SLHRAYFRAPLRTSRSDKRPAGVRSAALRTQGGIARGLQIAAPGPRPRRPRLAHLEIEAAHVLQVVEEARSREIIPLRLPEAALADEGVLGELDHDAPRVAALIDRLQQAAHELEVAGLLGGDVDADRGAGAERRIELLDRAHRLVDHEMGDRIDQPELDREPDERARRLDLAVLVAPAHQRLEPDHLLGVHVDLGLERAAELAVADREAQPLLELHAG